MNAVDLGGVVVVDVVDVEIVCASSEFNGINETHAKRIESMQNR